MTYVRAHGLYRSLDRRHSKSLIWINGCSGDKGAGNDDRAKYGQDDVADGFNETKEGAGKADGNRRHPEGDS
jgi:hypothetical protein